MLAPTIYPPTKLSDIPHHSRIQFSESAQPNIFFNSVFDSGNLSKVTRNSYDHYSIWTASDAEGSEHEGYPKSWFYFEVGGFKKRKINISVHRVHFLWAMVNRNKLYRPVYRTKTIVNGKCDYKEVSEWRRLSHPIQSLSVNSQQQLVLKFDFYFTENIQSVQFAFIYPYSHQQCHQDILGYSQKFENDKQVFFKHYELCRSYEKRVVDMIIISSHEGKEGFQNIKTDGTFSLGDKKLVRFRNNKPIIFISARVHPIQTPSSFTITGVIKFLLNKQDYRAHLLRKYFVFVLIPMLNPDGVSNGHCRMDPLNQNLNRYYNNPDPVKQPSCYSVMKLCQHYNKDERLFMYLDLHAHPANKGNFIFGNAIFDYIEQVQSQLFPKILSQNCINFEFQQCNFSRKHMKAKDRNQDMNKQGCGRVVFYRQFGLTHSYTLECGYHCNTYNNILTEEQNQRKVYVARGRRNDRGEQIYDNFEQAVDENEKNIEQVLNGLKQKKSNNGQYFFKVFKNVKDRFDDVNQAHYTKQVVFFQQQTFYNLGRNICISILDVWSKNPYTRVTNANEQRKIIAEKQAKLDRFRKEQVGIRTKQKRIVQLIQTQFYAEWHKKNIFQIQTINGGFKKTVTKGYQILHKRTDKSLTLTEAKEQIGSTTSISKIVQSKSLNKQRKLIVNKQEKKIGIVQPNIESIKEIVGYDPTKMVAPIKSLVDGKTFFKPLKIRNFQANK